MYLGNQGVCLEQKGQRLTNTTLGIDKIREPCRTGRVLTSSAENDSLYHCESIRVGGRRV